MRRPALRLAHALLPLLLASCRREPPLLAAAACSGGTTDTGGGGGGGGDPGGSAEAGHVCRRVAISKTTKIRACTHY